MVKYNDTLFLLVEVSNSEKTFQQQVSYCYLGVNSFIFSQKLYGSPTACDCSHTPTYPNTHSFLPSVLSYTALFLTLPSFLFWYTNRERPWWVSEAKARNRLISFRHTQAKHTHTQKKPTYIHTHTPIKYWSALCFLRSLRPFHCQHHTASTWRLRETS